MKFIKFIPIILFLSIMSCKSADTADKQSVTIRMLLKNGKIKKQTFLIPNDAHVVVRRVDNKAWLTYSYRDKDVLPTILKTGVTHALNISYNNNNGKSDMSNQNVAKKK